jgi:hypothetical protein
LADTSLNLVGIRQQLLCDYEWQGINHGITGAKGTHWEMKIDA